MSKYHKLVELYKDEIAEIKRLKTRYAELVDRANAVEPILHPEPDFEAINKADMLFDEAEIVYQDMIERTQELDQEIQATYHDVPYNKPRQAGIDGFWRESGLR